MIPFPDISPEIFTFSIGGIELALRWYAVSYLAGFLFSWLLMRKYTSLSHLWRFQTGPLDVDQVEGLITWLIIGVLLGGRLGYVVFYNADFYIENPLEIAKIWDGGMSFHGGFLGVVVATLLYCRYHGVLLWSCADLIALSAGPGIFLGRLANFINGELWGRPTDLPWGVIFPGERAQTCVNLSDVCARHPSQLYEAASEGLLMFIVLLILAHLGGLRRPRLVTSTFLIIYGLSRYFVEFFRVPDPQFFSAENPYGFAYSLGDFGFTMGQFLSLPMILFGVVLLLISVRSHRSV